MQTETVPMKLKTQLFTLDYTDIASTDGTTLAITLATLLPRERLMGIHVYVSAAFVGPNTLVMEIGDGTDPNEYVDQSNMKAAAGTEYGPVDDYLTGYGAIDYDGNSPIKATFTAGDNLNNATAGRVIIQATYLSRMDPGS